MFSGTRALTLLRQQSQSMMKMNTSMVGPKAFAMVGSVKFSTQKSSDSNGEWVAFHEPDFLQEQKHARLSKEQLKELKRLRQSDPEKYTQKKLAQMFNISRLVVARYAPCPSQKKQALQNQEQERKKQIELEKEARKQRKENLEGWYQKYATKQKEDLAERKRQQKEQFEKEKIEREEYKQQLALQKAQTQKEQSAQPKNAAQKRPQQQSVQHQTQVNAQQPQQ